MTAGHAEGERSLPAPRGPARSAAAALHLGDGRTGTVHGDLLWTLTLLSGGRAVVPSPTSAPQTEVDHRFYVLPGVARPRLLLPVQTGPVLRSALVDGNGLRSPRRRGGRALLERALAVPAVRRALGSEVALVLPPGTGDEPAPLWEHLSEVFGERVLLAMSVHRRAPHRKPLLQVLTPTGRTLGYAKLGWNPTTARAVQVEAASLARESTLAAHGIVIPQVLHHGSWAGHRVLVTAPLPPATSRYTWRSAPPPVSAVRTVAGRTTTAPLAACGYLSALQARLEPHRDLHVVAAVLETLTRLRDETGEVPVETGQWHGDWVPWNLARSGRSLLVWDWEFASSDVPVGFDALHYHFEIEATVRRSTAHHAASVVLARAGDLLDRLGVPAGSHALVTTLYLAENFARRLEISLAGRPANPLFLHDLGAVLSARSAAAVLS